MSWANGVVCQNVHDKFVLIFVQPKLGLGLLALKFLIRLKSLQFLTVWPEKVLHYSAAFVIKVIRDSLDFPTSIYAKLPQHARPFIQIAISDAFVIVHVQHLSQQLLEIYQIPSLQSLSLVDFLYVFQEPVPY
jgi:hypothetical protein